MIEKPKLGDMRTLRYLYDKEYQKMENVAENEIPVKITFEEFVELVKKMKHQQRRYFAKMNDTQLNLF